MIAKKTPEQVAEKIFDVVNQLNSGLALICEADEKERVAELNLRAGRKAKASTAYASACIYLSAGFSPPKPGDAFRASRIAVSLRDPNARKGNSG
jgi:hypothetical protein